MIYLRSSSPDRTLIVYKALWARGGPYILVPSGLDVAKVLEFACNGSLDRETLTCSSSGKDPSRRVQNIQMAGLWDPRA